MKKLLMISILVNCIPTNAQFSVDIGNDTSYCAGLFLHEPDTAYIGSNVDITGGRQPYTFSWSCEAKPSETLIFYASAFLNDTSVRNPYFKDIYLSGLWLEFTLKVTDADGLESYDSINIRFSSFTYNQQYYVLETTKSDSVQFYDFVLIAAIPPLTFTWEPAESLSDPHSLNPYASPDTTTEYSLSVIDSLGCVSDTFPYYKVIVNPSSGAENLFSNDKKPTISYYGKNISIGLHEEYCNKHLTVKLLTLDGKLVYSDLINGCNHLITLDRDKQAIYILALFEGNRLIYTDKILIE